MPDDIEMSEFVFDHKKAYEPDGPMGEHINALMELGRKNGCPLMIISVIASSEEGAEVTVHKSTRNGILPNAMMLAEQIMRLNMHDLDYIAQTIDMIFAANSNIEHVRSDITNAAQRIIADSVEADQQNAN